MRLALLWLLLMVAPAAANAQQPQAVRPVVTAPVLINRTEILQERERIARQLLRPGDSLMIKVYAWVDEKGVTRAPEIKTPSGNQKADSAAIDLVLKMRWQPAKNAKRGVMVTVPVKLVRKK